MIGVDWGTTSFRAYRFGPDGAVRDRKASALGIMNVPDARFADTLRAEIGPWLAAGDDRVLLSGMIGSRQGWVETPYLPCPAGLDDIAAALIDVAFDWARVKLVLGLSATDAAGVAEVMRGEETQILGVPTLLAEGGTACLPGTHAKWADVADGRIVGFSTHMTGEVFAALRGATILGRTMTDPARNNDAFAQGVRRSADPGGLLHHIFGVRAQTLTGALTESDAASYLSGILIGHEIRAQLDTGRPIWLVGSDTHLSDCYAQAIALCGGVARQPDNTDPAAAIGLAAIAARANWNRSAR